MSSPQSRREALEVGERAICMCTTGAACSSFAPGHALHLIQARLASATPAEWVDAIVESVDRSSGEIVLRALVDGRMLTVWSADDTTAVADEPVALHGRYAVLATASRRSNVALLGGSSGRD